RSREASCRNDAADREVRRLARQLQRRGRMRSAVHATCVLLMLVVALFCPRAGAQDPPPSQEDSSPTVQSLERRIQELEQTIRRMQTAGTGLIPASQTLPQGPATSATPNQGITGDQPPSANAPVDDKTQSAESSDGKSGDGEKKSTPVAGWDNGFF